MRQISSVISIVGAVLAVSACDTREPDPAETAAYNPQLVPPSVGEQATWSYEGASGPENWGNMNADFATCRTGNRQSPIDVPTQASGNGGAQPSLDINWASGPMMVEGQGKNANLIAPDNSFITFNGQRYNLVQAHMHTPGEMMLGGRRFPADLHFVHRNDAGQLAVVGVMVEEGAANPQLNPLTEAMYRQEGRQPVPNATFSPAELLPEDRDFAAFQGSLTTPPCTEGVQWIVMKEPITMSAQQIAAHRQAFGETARPVQPMNQREIAVVDN